MDLNLRGGSPGFVRVLGPNKIAFPDYPGNGSFITLGNMTHYPKAGILFPFVQPEGRMLQVVGDVEIKWDPGNCYEGMDREVIITVDQVMETRGVEEILEWRLKEISGFSPPVGADVSWWHQFGICSVFKLGEAGPGIMRMNFSSMGKTNWHWKPGQYATMLLPNPEGGEALTRSFTISQFQPTVEKEDGRMSLGGFGCHIKVFGRATDWLYNLPVDPENQVMGGDNGTEIRILGVEGDFCLDVLERDSKVPPKLLFLSAGIGITPMLAMLSGLKFARTRGQSYPVDAVLVHTSRSVAEIVDRQRLETLAADTQKKPEWANGSIRVEWGLTGAEEFPPGPHWHRGRLNGAILEAKVPDLGEREAYVCGPQDYMDAVVELLHKMGCPLSQIHTESFDTQA